ncbi:hypothetical protein CYMTET_15862 [Cymbomonas tetramitiformis]|uniref:Uncharacterized protein n=1 Tax=Cymbomonas tetramitiformis TaxID=36881 RepID=A0AAE0L8R3_9CHLO|nr:hypothetical protein CYMTET_15862 [Cymbomonas tetramitiformis]
MCVLILGPTPLAHRSRRRSAALCSHARDQRIDSHFGTLIRILRSSLVCVCVWGPSRLTDAYELGPGKVIAGIMKRIDRKQCVTNISA